MFWYAVERKQHAVGAAFIIPVRADTLRQRLNVARFIVIMTDKPEVGQPAPALQDVAYRIKGRGVGSGGVLRVQWQDQQAAGTCLPQFLQTVFDRRLAVTHRQRDLDRPGDILFQRDLQCLLLFTGDAQEG